MKTSARARLEGLAAKIFRGRLLVASAGVFVALWGCGGAEKRESAIGMPSPGPAPQGDAASPPAPSPNDLDASVRSAESDAGRSAVPWPDADACTFPPVSPAEGTTAKQCCQPAPSAKICLETKSLIHHHTVGPYTERTLLVTPVSTSGAEQAPQYFPLDRQLRGSMRRPDVVTARLSFRVHRGGLELRLRAGCDQPCRAKICSKEERLVANLCMGAGQYRWDGERLVSVAE